MFEREVCEGGGGVVNCTLTHLLTVTLLTLMKSRIHQKRTFNKSVVFNQFIYRKIFFTKNNINTLELTSWSHF